MDTTGRTRVKRVPSRGKYDKESIHSILDAHFLCHIGFVHEGYPVVIPTLYGRDSDNLYIHGASTSRMLKSLQKGIEISLAVTLVDGIVLARSAFHHSMNYRSVVLFGTAKLVVDPKEKLRALKIVSDQILKDRWEEVRIPNGKELKATTVLAIPIEEASAKVRTGPPIDDTEDYGLGVWAGVLPIRCSVKQPEPDPLLKEGIRLSPSVQNFLKGAEKP
jgi:nitroimidazol reductase NimA-like FMN-containing flavoprotein (pyridoxamine 5'-phosphate oxidase superfamily)